MKKLFAAAAMFALAFGFIVGAVLITPQEAIADYCQLEPEPFFWTPSTCQPEPGTKHVGQHEWIRLFVCEGYWVGAGTPCDCTYLGCVIDRTKEPPPPDIP